MGRPLPFDVIVFDELTKMQNAQAERHKAIRPRLSGVGYRWGLTGSLFAKGHMSIFGQQLILDDGAALGRYITHYRDTYFSVGFNGFDYDLIPGAEKRIIEKLAPYWFYMDPADYAQLPPLVDVPHIAEMDKQQRSLYERMKRDALISIGDQTITAANAGAVYSKLAQLANGAVYRDGHTAADDFELVHDLKLQMLEELLDELNGEPLLLGYEFQHDLIRIDAWYRKRTGNPLPYLGRGTKAKQEDEWIAAWNRGDLELLAAHPQSAGHGLNMQEGNAFNVAWWSVTWDWELFDQFIRRVRRSGNESTRIFNHLLIVKGTIDEEKLQSVSDKDFTERRLMSALNSQILAEGAGPTQETNMVTKLSRPQGEAGNGGAGASGWGSSRQTETAGGGTSERRESTSRESGAPSGWGQTTHDEHAEQRGRIQEKIAPNRAEETRTAFSGGIGDRMREVAGEYDNGESPRDQGGGNQQPRGGWGGQPAQEGDAPFEGGDSAVTTEKAPSTRRSRSKATAEPSPGIALDAALITARAQVMAAVIASAPDAEVNDIVDVCRDLMVFVQEG